MFRQDKTIYVHIFDRKALDTQLSVHSDKPTSQCCLLTCSFSTKSMKVVLSTSIGCPCRSNKAKTKWKKLDLRKLLGGCFSKWARLNPTLKNR